MHKRHESFEWMVTLAVAGDIAYKFAVHEAKHLGTFLAVVGGAALVFRCYEIVTAWITRAAENAIPEIEEG